MADLIGRQAILKHIEKVRQGALMMDDIRGASIIMNGMDLCEKAVMNQPSAHPERKNGHWIYYNDGNDEYYECSACGDAFALVEGNPKENDYNFCPNCGARMEDGKPCGMCPAEGR